MQRLTPKYVEPLSNIVFNFILRRYNLDQQAYVAVDNGSGIDAEKEAKFLNNPAHIAIANCCALRPSVDISVSFAVGQAGRNTPPLLSSTCAVLVTPPRVPLSNRLGDNHAPNVSHKKCLR